MQYEWEVLEQIFIKNLCPGSSRVILNNLSWNLVLFNCVVDVENLHSSLVMVLIYNFIGTYDVKSGTLSKKYIKCTLGGKK